MSMSEQERGLRRMANRNGYHVRNRGSYFELKNPATDNIIKCEDWDRVEIVVYRMDRENPDYASLHESGKLLGIRAMSLLRHPRVLRRAELPV